MMDNNSVWAIVPAAGIGRRFGADRPKQYLSLTDRSGSNCDVSNESADLVIYKTLATLAQHSAVAGIVVALAEGDPYWHAPDIGKPLHTVTGGAERVDSVRNALVFLHNQNCCDADGWVMVHDAARPCLHQDDLNHLLEAVADDSVGGLLAAPVADTLKLSTVADGDQAGLQRAQRTVDRSQLWRALTPQMFRFGLLLAALQNRDVVSSPTGQQAITDEASAIEALGYQPLLVKGRSDNLKITTQDDLELAKVILLAQSQAGKVQAGKANV